MMTDTIDAEKKVGYWTNVLDAYDTLGAVPRDTADKQIDLLMQHQKQLETRILELEANIEPAR